MSNKVEIEVGAKLDVADVEREINVFVRKVAQANRVQFNPVSIKSVEDVKRLTKASQDYLQVADTLRRKAEKTQQSGKLVHEMDFEAMFPGRVSRSSQMLTAAQRVFGPGVFTGVSDDGTPGRHKPGDGSLPGTVAKVAQAGLRAAGPVGSVASNAVGTGMSAGFGAGMMGLLGGLAALGVGKAIGAVMDGVDAAEKNAVALDRLKRVLGDVNVGFDALKTVVRSGSDSARVLYSDGARLTEGFVKAGNVKSDQFGSLGSELALGVGLSRSFGLDPDKGMGALGAVRGVGYTNNPSESRRFAALIGEAVGKSDAFAKADEVMDAISGFVVSQTRSSLGRVNAEGYAGALASLVGSGTPGMDPAGAAALLAKINTSLSAGGAKGEASQFLSAMVGKRMGLDPLQMAFMREGGPFATNDNTFGKGSIGKAFGLSGPAGNQTWMAARLEEIKRQYRYSEKADDRTKLMTAMAVGNDFGIGMRHAAKILMTDPKQIRELAKDFDLTQMNETAIGNLAKVRYGSVGDRESIKQSLLGRKDVSAEDKGRLATANQKTLEEMVAKYGQQSTQGTDIRDSKTALDNIKLTLAEKALPLFQAMRDGIILMAGGGKKSANEIAIEVAKLDYQDREEGMKGGFQSKRKQVVDEFDAKVKEGNDLARELRLKGSSMSGEERQAKIKRLQELIDGHALRQSEMQQRIIDLNKEEEEALKRLRKERDLEIEGIKKSNQERAMGAAPGSNDPETTGSISQASFAGGAAGAGAGRGSAYDLRRTDYGPVDAFKKDKAMKYFMEQGWSREQSAGIVANLWAESKLRERAVGDGGKAVGIAQWHPDRQAEFRRVFGKDLASATLEEQQQFVQYELTQGKEQAAGRALKGARTPKQAGAIVSHMYERTFRDEREERGQLAEQIAGRTPIPASPQAAATSSSGGQLTGQIEIIQRSTHNGPETGPRQVVPVKIKPNGRPVPAAAP